jgi:glycosyltransferase involved in cell wall biosynthesis
MAEKISQLIDDDKLRKEIVENGYSKIQNFNHKKYSEQLVKVIKKIHRKNFATRGVRVIL